MIIYIRLKSYLNINFFIHLCGCIQLIMPQLRSKKTKERTYHQNPLLLHVPNNAKELTEKTIVKTKNDTDYKNKKKI